MLYDYERNMSREMLEKISLGIEDFEGIDDYKNIFMALGKEMPDFDKLNEEGKSKEEILKEKEESLQKENNSRMEHNKEKYEKEREEIDNENYDRFLDDLKNQHGNFDNFWDDKGKKPK